MSAPTCASKSAGVLVVEHDPVIATDLYIGLEDLGFDPVGPVSSERQALDAIAQHPPETPLGGALLDCHLIEETSRGIAETLHRRGVPFVYVTGDTDFHAGGGGWPEAPVLYKPLGPSDLQRAVEALQRAA